MVEPKQADDHHQLDVPQDEDVFTRTHAVTLDGQDVLGHLRREFLVPSKADLKSETLSLQGL
jgi:hypothetical protein